MSLRYTKEHEWTKDEGGVVKIGITDYAQTELGDVVFVDLPQVGKVVKAGESVANVESVKAVSDIYAPVSGSVVEVNASLASSPELINSSPTADGWIVTLKPDNAADLNSLMDEASYSQYISEISK